MSFASGKIALVTGGTSGIGLCVIKKLLRNELKGVTIADIDAETGEKIVGILSQEFGTGRILFVKTDVTRHQDVEDIVINCAGIFNDRAYEKSVAINLCGTIRTSFMAMEHYLPQFKSSSEALIINLSSICGLEQFPSCPVYVATKHGVLGFSRSLGTEEHFKRTAVRVLSICPGLTYTPLLQATDDQYCYSSYKEPQHNKFVNRPVQKAEVIADALEQIVSEGETGSAWIIEGGITSKVNFPNLLKSY